MAWFYVVEFGKATELVKAPDTQEVLGGREKFVAEGVPFDFVHGFFVGNWVGVSELWESVEIRLVKLGFSPHRDIIIN